MADKKPRHWSGLCSIRTCIYILVGLHVSIIVLTNILFADKLFKSLILRSKQPRDDFKHSLNYVYSDSPDVQHGGQDNCTCNKITAIQSGSDSTVLGSILSKQLTAQKQIHPTIKSTIFKVTTKSRPVQPTPRPDQCKSCFEHKFRYVINNKHICDSGEGNSSVDIIVLILTIHANREARDTLRQTWLTPTKNNTSDIRYAFLLGNTSDPNLNKRIEAENMIYHDILQEDFVDAYMNLTYKTIMAFKWASTTCKQAKFVMKADDDMYVNLDAVKHVVSVHGSSLQVAVGGACHMSARPIRDKKSKWYASMLSYPKNTYPGYCSGTGYVTSMNVASKIYEASKHVPFFHLEDVYVALCIKKLGYKLKRIAGFNSGRIPPGCAYKTKNVVTSHNLGLPLIRKMWNLKC
ncbi:beta-1,3-galactosyltransferase 1-like [Saccostrea echinata]|uniref:beta-1,3-galactosyltransferase 1-like n=1 Tax=Saccostrea echinata TaxID=191078 RepID=UPI002A82BC23|nr:beta-1,3-galactosyltransferase 1-like [Saccostrea echinata]